MPRIDTILAPGEPVDKAALRAWLGARETATPEDYGGIGDGIHDCSPAFAAALAERGAVVLSPDRSYRISEPIRLGYGQALLGHGETSVIQARIEPFDGAALPGYPSAFNAVELISGYATLAGLRIVGGGSGVKLFGRTTPCVKNVIERLSIWDAVIGITLDGYDNPDRPCYWNSISRVLIGRPQLHGVLLTVESTGDTPNANKFHDVRVYSLSAPMNGCGFFVSTGCYNNAFLDCEANLHPAALACFRLGAMASQNQIINFYAECSGAVPGIRIDGGAADNTIVNLFSATGGAPIWDTTAARAYQAFNAGHPVKNLLKKTLITDLRAEAFGLEARYIEPAGGGLIQTDLIASTYLISSYGGQVEFRLPAAAETPGRIVTIKKTDLSANPVLVTEQGGAGPDGRTVRLVSRFDFVQVTSNGAGWWIVGGSNLPLASQFFEGQSLVQPDCQRELYLVSAGFGDVEFRLPAPSSAAGRRFTIKKSDPYSPVVRVTQTGGGGPDSEVITLAGHGHALTVMSDGGRWLILSRYQ
jgi:hypothetical protein